ncbi:MAG: TetR/AcrR family transcriptional regulator [Pseudomonadota bacterium]
MARYSAAHKAQSRAALIQAGADLFRARGYNGVGIDELCAEAGLTRGAFYGHFNSKAELLAAVLRGNHDFARRLKARSGKTTQSLRRQGARIARDYLDPDNRQAVVGGCSISALSIDAIRADAGTRAAYVEGVLAVLKEMRRGQDDAPLDADAARAALALCVGGLLLDNACGEDPEGPRIARAAQKLAGALLEGKVDY